MIPEEFESAAWQLETKAVRSGTQRSQFNEHSEALFLTSSFVFDNAAQAAARFSGQEAGPVYSRFTNPTVEMFQTRLAEMEGGEACIATASGMSAILTCMMGLLKAGDHVVASRSLFGATVQLFSQILGRFGVETTFVSQTDPQEWETAIRSNTKLFYFETPSNPVIELADIATLSEIAHRHGLLAVADNCFCTPAIQRPLSFGADLVVHSATKYIDGQGRSLGGAIVGSRALIIESGIYPFLRTAGPSMSPFNAWLMLKGLETLHLRMRAQSETAFALAQWLEAHPKIAKVNYPFLVSHPQYDLAKKQQIFGGAVISFEIKGAQTAAWHVVDSTKMLSITANLGDTRTTITHPATTTHGRLSPEARAAAGVKDSLLRLSVGLEHLADIQADLSRGLDQI